MMRRSRRKLILLPNRRLQVRCHIAEFKEISCTGLYTSTLNSDDSPPNYQTSSLTVKKHPCENRDVFYWLKGGKGPVLAHPRILVGMTHAMGAFFMAEVFTVAPTRVGFNPSMKGVIVILRLDRGIQVNKETIFDLDVRIKSEHDRGERCLIPELLPIPVGMTEGRDVVYPSAGAACVACSIVS